MQRRKFCQEFKIGAAKSIRDRGVAVAQGARNLDFNDNVRCKKVGMMRSQ